MIVEEASAVIDKYIPVSDLPSWLSTVTFGAMQALPKLTNRPFPFVPDPNLLYKVLAWYTLLYAGTCLYQRKLEFDGVGTIIGPVTLGVNAIGGVGSVLSALDVATGLFGFFLAHRLPGPPLVWLPTLALAIYYGWGFHWIVAAFAGAAAWKLVDGVRQGALPLSPIAFIAAAGLAYITDFIPQFAMLVFGGQILASALGK